MKEEIKYVLLNPDTNIISVVGKRNNYSLEFRNYIKIHVNSTEK